MPAATTPAGRLPMRAGARDERAARCADACGGETN
ncbi:hypothetical protein M218_20480 [Burkholderia pseudomallei MSHR338]|nr:hypothetical protein M218_20480 [Burkholderia pseudomallei MSHR338]